MTFEAFWDEDYLLLEEEFLNFVKYVPLVINHDEVWSMKLANLLLLIGSSIDSFFKKSFHYCLTILTKEYYFNNHGNFHPRLVDFEKYQHQLRNDRTNMGSFRDVFKEFYEFSDEPVYILKTKRVLKPFSRWSQGQTPEWWKVYRDLKHDRIKNREKCTLNITLNALAALFFLNVYHVQSRKKLMEHRKVINSNLNIGYLIREMDERGNFEENLNPILAKTNLFGYIFKGSHYYQYPWHILDPGHPQNVYHF